MYAGAITLAAPIARPPQTRQIVRSTGPIARALPREVMKKTIAAIIMTRGRPSLFANVPANQAPTAQPSSAEETTTPVSIESMFHWVSNAVVVPLITAVS